MSFGLSVVVSLVNFFSVICCVENILYVFLKNIFDLEQKLKKNLKKFFVPFILIFRWFSKPLYFPEH